MGRHGGRAVLLQLSVSLAITSLCWTLTSCGVKPAPSADASGGSPSAPTTAPSASRPADHSAAVSAELGKAGLKLVATTTSRSNPTEQILTLASSGARATVTFQDDTSVLRSQFETPTPLPDGAYYATQPMGFGGVSVLVYKSGRAVVLTLIPVVANGQVPLSADAAIHSADSLLTTS